MTETTPTRAGWLSKGRIIAPPGYNRWIAPIASVAIHLCIGSVYAWSLFNPPLTKVEGVVAGAPGDWTLNQVLWVFSLAIVFLGLSAAVGGKWLERVGPRAVGFVSACCWGGGFLLGALGIWSRQLWLLYLGYGVVGGCGLGLGYVSPVSTLIKWFPDRRGMAAGMAIMGFGGGALLATPLDEWLLRHYYRAPDYLGPADRVPLVTESGRRFAEVDGVRREVVVVGANDVAAMPVRGPEGVYAVGTGRVGAAETFATLGLLYFAVMTAAAFSYRLPAPGWAPPGYDPKAPSGKVAEKARALMAVKSVDPDRALQTPQFYLLWVVLCCNVTAGIGVLGIAKTMMTELFGPPLPDLVTPAFASAFVLMLSVFNMAGRFGWASASDYLGRQWTYWCFFVLGIALYLAIPWTAGRMAASPSAAWLWAFYAIVAVIMTMYGGGFATIPAYLADVFGLKYVGAIHGRLLTAWSVAGVLGPLLLAQFRERELDRLIRQIAATVDPDAFLARFGAPVAKLDELVAAKTVTLPKLAEMLPSGTPNPSLGLYNSSMYLMAGLLAVALVCNALVRPVHTRHHEEP